LGKKRPTVSQFAPLRIEPKRSFYEERIVKCPQSLVNTTSSNKQISYFSVEIALDPAMPTYSGGLGILAGALKTYILVATLTDRKTWRTQDEQRNSCCY
jgi:hypothetical protein